MPAIVALPAFWSAVAGVAGGTGAVNAAHKIASASTEAANITSTAATNAAQIDAQSKAAALAFSRQQAEKDYQNQEIARQGNYNQWASQQQRLGSLGGMLGLGPRNIPAYVPSQDPQFTPSAGAPPSAGTVGAAASGPTSSTNLSDPNAWMGLVRDPKALSTWVAQGLGPAAAKPGLVDYYVGKIHEQPGANPTEQAGGAAYWLQKLQAGAGGTSATSAVPPPAAAPAGSLASLIGYRRAPLTPALAAPYGTVGAYAGGY